MKERAAYKNALRSKKLIREAFIALVEEKDFSKVTVTDIVKMADINRGTFYAHYADTRAIAQEMQDEVIDGIRALLNEFRFESFLLNPQPQLLKISQWLETDMLAYRRLIHLRGAEHFIMRLKEIFVKLITTDTDIPEFIKALPEYPIHTHFLAGGIISIYQAWISGTLDCSGEEIAAEVSKFIVAYAKPL